MGWTSSADMRSQVQLEFDTAEEAVAYAGKHGIPYQVFEPHTLKPDPSPIRTISASTERCPGRIDGAGRLVKAIPTKCMSIRVQRPQTTP